jgi:hypothetical protein
MDRDASTRASKDFSFLQSIAVSRLLASPGNFVAQLDAHPAGAAMLPCLVVICCNCRKRRPY